MFFTAIYSLVAVLALIGLLSMGARFIQSRAPREWRSGQNLQIVETVYLDNKTRLHLVQCHEMSYMVLVGAHKETIIPCSPPPSHKATVYDS
ncbi:MAG: flagellar biosynthetic protein FliO [Alphaproteobacteria bacterium]|nr:flagellar biosynthetic protein FliO [Alphaproteobacteria bacterium]